jgi:DNA-binding response OmpR family regulator
MIDSPSNPSSQVILIVDDIPDNLRVLSAALSEQNYQVRCAKNGSLALMGAKNATPDLILLDIQMPDMNGYEVCKKLKADIQTSEIPVIFLSALDDVFDKVEAFTVGGVDYITKPFQVEEVLVRVRHQLALQAAKTEIIKLNTELEQKIAQRTAQLAEVVDRLNQDIIDRDYIKHRSSQKTQNLEVLLNSLKIASWSAILNPFKLSYLDSIATKIYDRHVSELLDNSQLWLDCIHPEDRDRVETALTNPSDLGTLNLEYRILRPDRTIVWLNQRGRINYDENNKAIGIDGLIIDITKNDRLKTI